MRDNFLKKLIEKHRWFLVILVLAAGLRFYRLPEMASFDFDQEYASTFAYDVLRQFPIRMIGQGLSVEGFFMGPFYFYYLTPFFALFGLHPIGGAIGSVFLGLIIVGAYYYFGCRFFGTTAGLIAAFLRGILFGKIEADWSMVPSYSSELLVLVTWFIFYQYWQGKTKLLPLLGLVFGLYTSFHPILFPFYLVFLFLLLWKRKLPNLKNFVLSAGAFLIATLPLIAFEFFHNFLEVRKFLELVRVGSKSAVNSAKLVSYLKIILEGLHLGIEIKPSYLLSVLVLAVMVILMIRKSGKWQEPFHLVALVVTIMIFAVYYFFLPVHVSGYYLMAPSVLLFFYFTGLLGHFFSSSNFLKPGVILFLFYVSLFNIKLLSRKWSHPNLTALYHKDRIVKAIAQRRPENGNFYVSIMSLPGWNFGFSYLLRYYNLVPYDRPVEGATYTIVVPKDLSPDSIGVSFGNVGLIFPEDN